MSYIDEKDAALLVIAYPHFSETDKKWIDDFRKEHDSLFYNIVKPHIVFVFPTFGIEEKDFISDIIEKAKDMKEFNFIIRCAMMNHDKLSEYNHIFLSPDEGNSIIVKMHDTLYSGIIKKSQRLDVDFFSHIAIGNYKDPTKCKDLIDQINAQNINIFGSVTSLDIISYGNQKICQIKNIKLS
jgi:hypothetical protein